VGLIVLGLRYEPSAARIVRAVERPHRPLLRIEHVPSTVIRRQELPYWQERGWTHDGQQYQGTYQTSFGSFVGCVQERGFGDMNFYLKDPPPQLQGSGHWACFQDRRDGWYGVHMSTPPRDVSSGILTIERLIASAFEA